ncbi:serine/threonine protein kinase [Planctomicrobium sp. SH668]|uniref:serine/threonine protein kinase n=1 Tax=Planctomicrobium sp. SH668 TaxID=3448126 RepID=UPI003F5B5DCD
MSFLKRLFSGKRAEPKVDIEKRFQLQTPIGRGTMSKVWKAIDRNSGRTVALKVLDKAKTLRLEQRFVGMNRPKEGEMAMKLNHENVVKTLEHGLTTHDEQFLVMEFIEGMSLGLLVESQNARMKANCLSYCIQLGEALDYLHRSEWIHRDLSPRNVLITNDNRVKVIDFGLMVPNTEVFRRPGNRTGAAAFMAPELIKRMPTDERIDIYSYAMSCYEMYTKHLPWPSADTMEAVLQHLNAPPKEIRAYVPGLDPQIAETIMKGLERNRDDRWKSVGQMVSEFRAAASRQ